MLSSTCILSTWRMTISVTIRSLSSLPTAVRDDSYLSITESCHSFKNGREWLFLGFEFWVQRFISPWQLKCREQQQRITHHPTAYKMRIFHFCSITVPSPLEMRGGERAYDSHVWISCVLSPKPWPAPYQSHVCINNWWCKFCGTILGNKTWATVTLNGVDKYHRYKEKKEMVTQNTECMIFVYMNSKKWQN